MTAEELSGRDLGRQLTTYVRSEKQLINVTGRIIAVLHDQYGIKVTLDNRQVDLKPKDMVSVV